jgi:hypothetical protein
LQHSVQILEWQPLDHVPSVNIAPFPARSLQLIVQLEAFALLQVRLQLNALPEIYVLKLKWVLRLRVQLVRLLYNLVPIHLPLKFGLFCVAGSYCATNGLLAATDTCSAGTYCPEGSSAKSNCPIGSYCPNSGMATPTACPRGSYCPSTNMLSPTTCSPGNYCPLEQQTSQTQCPGGETSHTEIGHGRVVFNLNFSLHACAFPHQLTGFYCQSSGLSTTTARCGAGTFCIFLCVDCSENSSVFAEIE